MNRADLNRERLLSLIATIASLLLLSACESAEVKISPTRTVRLPADPSTVTWSLARFEEAWNSVPSEVEKLEVIQNLRAYASVDFDWPKFWHDFASEKILWPKDESVLLHSKILDLASLSGHETAFKSFSEFARVIFLSNLSFPIKQMYFEHLFSEAKQIAALGFGGEAIQESLSQSLFQGPNTLKVSLNLCDNDERCSISQLIKNFTSQPDRYFAEKKPQELLGLLEIFRERSRKRSENLPSPTVAHLKASIEEAEILKCVSDRVEEFLPDAPQDLFSFIRESLQPVERLLETASLAERVSLQEFLEKEIKEKSTLEMFYFLTRLSDSSFWEEAYEKMKRENGGRPLPFSDALLQHRLNIRMKNISRSDFMESKAYNCRFYENLKLPEVRLNPLTLNVEFGAGGLWHLPPGCFDVESGYDSNIEIKARKISFDPDAVLTVIGRSLTLNAEVVEGGVIDLSADLSHVSKEIFPESRSDRDALAFPLALIIRVPDTRGSQMIRSEACEHHPKAWSRGYEGEGEHLRFCAGEHIIFFHMPFRFSSEAPRQVSRPPQAESGGNIYLNEQAFVKVPLALQSFRNMANSAVPGELGGHATVSHNLSELGDELTHQASLHQWIEHQIFDEKKQSRPRFVHPKLSPTLVARLLEQTQAKLEERIFRVSVLGDLGYLDLLHSFDKAQLMQVCGSPLEAMFLSCAEKLEPEVQTRLLSLLRLLTEPSPPIENAAINREEKILLTNIANPYPEVFNAYESLQLNSAGQALSGPPGDEGSNGNIFRKRSTTP